MAKLTGPLMSFGASGQLGKTIVLGAWKGINTARQYVIPSNPRSVGQIAQRAIFSTVVNCWRSVALTALVKAGWNRLASLKTAAVSGFNVFQSNVTRLAAEVPAGSIAISAVFNSWDDVGIVMANLDTMGTGTEAGNFSVLFGATPDQMVFSASLAIVAGVITLDATDAQTASNVFYVQVRKAGTGTDVYDRSGIVEITAT
jgi:hypothetical protein